MKTFRQVQFLLMVYFLSNHMSHCARVGKFHRSRHNGLTPLICGRSHSSQVEVRVHVFEGQNNSHNEKA